MSSFSKLTVMCTSLLVGLLFFEERARANTCPCAEPVQGRVFEYFAQTDTTFELEGAKVQWHDGLGELRETETNAEGEFRFNQVCPTAQSAITVEFDGYKTTRIQVTECGEPLDVALSIDEENMAELGLTVTTRTTRESRDSRARVTLFGEELDEERGVPLARMLETLPGVRALDTGNVSKPVIHGMHSNRVVLLFDGLRHESLSWGLDHAPEIDPFMADRISVIKGAAGVRYGPDAIGGVILVDPKPLPFDDPTLHGDVHAVGISNGRQGVTAARLYGRVPRLPGFSWRVQGSGKVAGSLETPTYVLDNTGARELNLSAAAAGLERPTWGLELAASRYDATNGLFTGVVSENLTQFEDAIMRDTPRGVERYQFDYEIERPYQEVVHTVTRADGYLELAPDQRVELTLAHQLNERSEYDITRQSVTGPQLGFTLSTGTLEAAWTGKFLETWRASAGLVGLLQTHIYRGRRFIPNYEANGVGGFGWVKREGRTLDVELGARADITHMTTYQREAIGGSTAPIEQVELLYVTPSLVAGTRWRLAEELEASFHLSSASRAPTIDELFIDGVSQGVASFLEGDRELEPEQTWAATAQLEASRSWFTLHLSPYLQYIDDYIYAAPELDANGEARARLTIQGSFPSFAYSQVDALFAGVDAQLEVSPVEWLELTTKGAVVRARDLTRDAYLVFIPPDMVSQDITLTSSTIGPLKNASLGGQLAYTAEQTRVDLDADFAPPPEAFVLLHAHANAEFSFGPRTFRTSVEVKNLTNQRYRSYLSRLRYFADEPGRSVNLRVKYAF